MKRSPTAPSASLLGTVVLAALVGSCRALAPPDTETAPPPCPPDWRALLGTYGTDVDEALVLERDGGLFVRSADGEERALLELGDGTFRASSRGRQEEVRFERDDTERATALTVDGHAFARRDLPAAGEEAEEFRVAARFPEEELRRRAAEASAPVEEPKRESDLVDLRTIEGLRFDIRYATERNFLGTRFYERPEAWAQRPAAEALERAQRRLAERGYGILVYDAFRPWRVTKMFWDATPEELRDFVADPSKGSRHNRGCALDVTLYRLETGEPVVMPSGYDEFSPRAAPDWPGGTSRERWHRDLLRAAMEAEGFRVYPNEWWHFDLEGWEAYPILLDFPPEREATPQAGGAGA